MTKLPSQANPFLAKKFHDFFNPRETTFFVYNRTHSWRYVLPSGVVEIDDISFRAGSSRFGSCASLFGFPRGAKGVAPLPLASMRRVGVRTVFARRQCTTLQHWATAPLPDLTREQSHARP